MREERQERRKVHLFIGLFVSFAGPALALPGYGLTDDGRSLPYVKMDRTGDPEEEASLLDEALKLDAVLAYAQGAQPSHQGGTESRFGGSGAAHPGLSPGGPDVHL